MSFGMPAGPSSAFGRAQKETLLGGPHLMDAESLLAFLLAGQPTSGQLALSVMHMQGGDDQGDVGIQMTEEGGVSGGAFTTGPFGGLRHFLLYWLAVNMKRTDCQIGENAVQKLLARHFLPPAPFPDAMSILTWALEALSPRPTPTGHGYSLATAILQRHGRPLGHGPLLLGHGLPQGNPQPWVPVLS